ncbi:MAG: hypothetical protein QXE79_06805 [Candidatus Bathyarchaeia archaeon]
MEAPVGVDKQGRMVLPKDVREALKIDGDAEIICRIVGNRIVLEKFSVDSIRGAFAELEEIAPSLELDRVKLEEEDKIVDREYALRKIGVRSTN